jgi:DNA-binding NtrC family response regulator
LLHVTASPKLAMTTTNELPNTPNRSKDLAGANERIPWDELQRQLTRLHRHDGSPAAVLDWLRRSLDSLSEPENDIRPAGRQPAAEEQPERRRLPQVSADAPRHEFAWDCPVSQHLYAQILRVAQVDSTVLLTGESGTGKSTIARMIHLRSSRHNGPFVAVNCGSLPRDLIDAELFGHAKGAFTGAIENRPGRAEAADGGTLFLDEIGDLPLELQPKLLTFLQERTFYRIGSNRLRNVDVRVISATHTNLLEMSESADFRPDLFFRLAVLRLQVPSLCDRRSEIRAMATRILKRIANCRGTPVLRISKAACRALEQYKWPGNIRELENVLENAAAFIESGDIQVSDLCLSPHQRGSSSTDAKTSPLLGKTLAEIECEAIVCALQHFNGNKSQTATALGISLRSVYNKMRRHGLVISKSPVSQK